MTRDLARRQIAYLEAKIASDRRETGDMIEFMELSGWLRETEVTYLSVPTRTGPGGPQGPDRDADHGGHRERAAG